MWSKVTSFLAAAKALAIAEAIWAEANLVGKSGAEKKAAVVKRVSDMISVPWYLVPVKGWLIGYAVDFVVEKLNALTGKSFAAPSSFVVMEVEAASVDVPVSKVDAKIESLRKQYQIEPPLKAGYLSKNFTKKEFACKCGCGFASPNPKLVEGLQALRDLLGKPIVISSACRCVSHNKAVGGEVNPPSQHTRGAAADISVAGMSVSALAAAAEKIPVFKAGGIGQYPKKGFVHVDVRGKVSRWTD